MTGKNETTKCSENKEEHGNELGLADAEWCMSIVDVLCRIWLNEVECRNGKGGERMENDRQRIGGDMRHGD